MGEFLHLFNDFLGAAGDLGAANVGDDAVCAEVVAAAHDADKRLGFDVVGVGIVLHLEGIQCMGFGWGGCGADVCGYGDAVAVGSVFQCGGEHVGDLWYLCGACDDIHGGMGEQLEPEPLSHTAHDGNDGIGAGLLEVLEVAEMREDAVLGVGADGAGVYQNGVGVGGFVGDVESGVFERGGYQRRIKLVHLAAEGLYVDFSLSHGTGEYMYKPLKNQGF